jgi:ArsR family transcriptional regulator
MEKLTKTLKALSDTNRIRILKMLENRELCVCEISSVLQLANSTVSQHLSILKEAGLITDEKEGKWVNYRLISSPESIYCNELMPLIKKWLADEQIIRADIKKLESTNRNQLCG